MEAYLINLELWIAHCFAVLFVVLALLGFYGLAMLIVRAIRNAPDGYEDATGFHQHEPPRVSYSLDRTTPDRDRAFFTRHKIKL